MLRLEINLFGSVDVFLDGEAVSGFRSNKARGLLAYLAVEANRPIARTRLATLFWGDYPDAQAGKSLRNVLANLRQILTPADGTEPFCLTIDRQTVQLTVDGEACAVDVVRFDELIRCAETVVSIASAQALMAQAVDLYRADLLADLSDIDSANFAEWRRLQQEARHRQLMAALQHLTAVALDQADYRAAQTYAQRQLQFEPWQENAHCQLMYAFAAQGERHAAQAQFETCRRVLLAEVGAEPEAETVALYTLIRDGEFVVPASDGVGGKRTTGQEKKKPALPTSDSGVDSSAPLTSFSTGRDQIRGRLESLSDQQLFGVETARARLFDVLQSAERPWLVALDGIGGMGKTTLAGDLAHAFVGSARFVNIGWVSAKQEEFQPAAGIQTTGRPALDVVMFTDSLLDQLLDQPPLSASPQEKQRLLRQLLKAQPHLVVVDNLESIHDLDALTPYLRELANPTKFLLTTRFSLHAHAEVYSYTLRELSEHDTLALLRHEATARGMTVLHEATPAELNAIYQVVGGNPLALKLVMGQVSFLPLTRVLTNLAAARGKRVDELYTYIYWQAWQLLNADERQLFLTMPLAPNATFDQLALVSALEEDSLQLALTHLIERSLVQVAGDLSARHYHLHRLTETFLMNEVLKWQSMA